MTIDERVDALMRTLPYTTKSEGGVAGFRERLKTALWEVARDQRNACAEAIAAIEIDNEDGIVGVGRMRYAAKQAVMNAALEAK